MKLKLDTIRTDGGTQSRAELNPAVVEDYVQTIREGIDFPPVVVFHDGKKYWLADGFHRAAAYRAAGAIEIETDIRQGERREAILFSVGANASHGLRRNNDDKRRAVMTLLNDKEWSTWSDRDIARQCAVSHTFVAKHRPTDTGNVASMERTFTHPKTGKPAKMDTTKIGKADRGADKAARDVQQAGWDRDQEEARRKLAAGNPRIAAGEAAKHANGARDAAVAGNVPPDPEDHADAIRAHRDELLEENEALKADIADRDARLVKYDDMVVQYEKGGFEAVIGTRDERIQGLLRQVETISADRASIAKSRDWWRKTAIDLGYVSPNSQVEVDPKTPAHDDLSEEAGF